MSAIYAHAHLPLSFSQCSVRGAFDRISKSKSRRRNEQAVHYSRKIRSVYLPKLAKGIVLRRVKALSEDERAAAEAVTVDLPVAADALSADERAAAEAEREAKRIRAIKEDWVVRGWAPWEHVLTPEADFAIKGVNDTQNDDMRGLRTAEGVEAFERVTPRLRNPNNYDFEGNMVLPPQRTLRIGDEEYELVPRTSQWGEPEPNETEWNSPLVFTLIPPRDWPPPGWHVDAEELAFIREAHKLESVRVDPRALENPLDDSNPSFPRFELFMKQYNHWVAANKDMLDKEAAQIDRDYHPGRRRTGSEYIEGMYELPFVYPGQIYGGHVTSVHLYQGAFVHIGCVHDGWVPIKGNDWYWVRHHIKVGMHVQVEVVAKRDPFRYRFPIELRFVNPNIDHLIFNKFEFPPLYQCHDTTPEELSRETGRPYLPRRRLSIKPEDRPLSEIHPYSKKIGEIHILEQELLDREEKNLNEEEEDLGKEGEQDGYIDELEMDNKLYNSDGHQSQTTDERDLVMDAVHAEQKTIDEKDLDMDAARAELKTIYKIEKESRAQEKTFVLPILRREKQMKEFDAMHKQRSIEEREALKRDISCRLELGLPIEEPGRYAGDDFWNKVYTTWNPRYRSDYWGDTSDIDVHNPRAKRTHVRSRGTVNNSDDNLVKSPSTNAQNVVDNSASKTTEMPKKENTTNYKSDNFAKGENITTTRNGPHLDGTDSFSTSDVQGIFDDQDNSNDSKRGRGAADSDTEDK